MLSKKKKTYDTKCYESGLPFDKLTYHALYKAFSLDVPLKHCLETPIAPTQVIVSSKLPLPSRPPTPRCLSWWISLGDNIIDDGEY